MIDFFNHFVRIEKDASYNNLSMHHFLIILLFILGIFLILRLYRFDKNFVKTQMINRFLTILLIFVQIIYYSWYFITRGDYDPYPLYICRISALLFCITYFFHVQLLEDFAIFSGIYGSLCAVILSTPSPFAFPHIMRTSYFVLHMSLGFVALSRLLLRKGNVSFKLYLKTCIINMFVFSGVFILDKLFSWNYSFFITPPLFYNTYQKMNPSFYTAGVFFAYFFLLFLGYLVAKTIKKKYA